MQNLSFRLVRKAYMGKRHAAIGGNGRDGVRSILNLHRQVAGLAQIPAHPLPERHRPAGDQLAAGRGLKDEGLIALQTGSRHELRTDAGHVRLVRIRADARAEKVAQRAGNRLFAVERELQDPAAHGLNAGVRVLGVQLNGEGTDAAGALETVREAFQSRRVVRGG